MRILKSTILALIVGLLAATSAFALPSSQIWESLTATDDSEYEVYGNIWFAETITVSTEAHSISQVRFLAYREGTPGTITASIRKTSAGLPTGSDLTSGTTNGDAFTTDTAGVWYAIDFTEYSLEASTQYAIVFRATAGTATAALHLRYDGSAATYAGGSEINSTNGGVSWTADTDDDLLFEVWGKALLEVTGAQVYRSYLETDDMLFVTQYYNTYVPYYPNFDSASYFYIQLRDATGATVLAQTTCRAWGNKPGAIYLSADSAASLTYGTAYRIYIYGNFTGTPTKYFTLASADWRGSNLDFLDTWVLTTARDIGTYYNTSFTTFTGVGEVLNEEGGTIFAIGIPALPTVRPDIFYTTSHTPGYTPGGWTNAFAGAVTWEEQVGPTASGALNSMSNLFGIDGKAIGAFILLAVYLALALGVAARGGDATLAVFLGIPFILLGTWLRLIDIAITATIAGVALLLVAYRFWWSRT